MTQPDPHVQPPTREVRVILRMLPSEACLWLEDYNTLIVHAGLSPVAQQDAIRRTLDEISRTEHTTTTLLALTA